DNPPGVLSSRPERLPSARPGAIAAATRQSRRIGWAALVVWTAALSCTPRRAGPVPARTRRATTSRRQCGAALERAHAPGAPDVPGEPAAAALVSGRKAARPPRVPAPTLASPSRQWDMPAARPQTEAGR